MMFNSLKPTKKFKLQLKQLRVQNTADLSAGLSKEDKIRGLNSLISAGLKTKEKLDICKIVKGQYFIFKNQEETDENKVFESAPISLEFGVK